MLLTQFEKAGIKVIRMGLQPTLSLKSGELLADLIIPVLGNCLWLNCSSGRQFISSNAFEKER